jgi:peptide/nickel transport system permease protein
MDRKRYVFVRTIQMVFLLWLVLSLLFVFFRLLPGDFTGMMIYRGATEATVEAFREKWGLNDPLYVQYWKYMSRFVQGDVGTSVVTQTPVIKYVRMKLFNSFILIAPGITFGYVLGSIFGAIFGRNRGSKLEEWGLLPVIFAGSFPAFFIALVLVIVFAGVLNWFPTSGMVSYGQTFGEGTPWWKLYTSKSFMIHYILPFSAIVLRYLYSPTLIMRTSVVEVLGQDFTFYHRITGISEFDQLKHLIRHSMLPVITLYPVSMTRAIGGLVLIEKVFNWPGIGSALVSAVLARDYPVVQFIFFLVAAFVILANFGIDILYGIIDPRVSIDEE